MTSSNLMFHWFRLISELHMKLASSSLASVSLAVWTQLGRARSRLLTHPVPVWINTAARVSPARLPFLSIMYDIMEEEVLEFQAAELPDEPRFCSQAAFNDKPDSLFFNDGARKIDFILVYEDEDKKEFEKRHASQRRKVASLRTAHDTCAHLFIATATPTFITICDLNRCFFWFLHFEFPPPPFV